MNLLHSVVRAECFGYDASKKRRPLSPDRIIVAATQVAELKGLPVAVVGSARVPDHRHVLSRRK